MLSWVEHEQSFYNLGAWLLRYAGWSILSLFTLAWRHIFTWHSTNIYHSSQKILQSMSDGLDQSVHLLNQSPCWWFHGSVNEHRNATLSLHSFMHCKNCPPPPPTLPTPPTPLFPAIAHKVIFNLYYYYLGKFSRWQMNDNFSFFPENWLWNFLQEMLKPIFLRKEKYFKMLSAEIFTQHAKLSLFYKTFGQAVPEKLSHFRIIRISWK